MDLSLGDSRLIIGTCKSRGLLRNQCAYVLATSYHESAHTMKPITEMGSQEYLRSKSYWPFIGRGYVQLTWKSGYQKASDKLGVDFVSNPSLLLEAQYAAPILVIGMLEAWFTGKKLSDYIDLQHSDFVGARRIINGIDRANLIALYATQYDALLKAEGYGEATTAAPVQAPAPVQTAPAPTPAPVQDQPAVPTPVPSPQPAKVETPPSKPPVPKPSAKPAAAAGLFVILATALATYWREVTAWLHHFL